MKNNEVGLFVRYFHKLTKYMQYISHNSGCCIATDDFSLSNT